MSDKFHRHGSRYRARARAVDLIFEAEQRDADPLEVIATHKELARVDEEAKPIRPYTETIIEGIAVEMDTIDDTIKQHLAEGWALEHIPAVDRAILRVCVWELLFNPEVPPRVVFKEGAELGAQYSTVVASPYINAVLDSIVKNISAEAEESEESDN